MKARSTLRLERRLGFCPPQKLLHSVVGGLVWVRLAPFWALRRLGFFLGHTPRYDTGPSERPSLCHSSIGNSPHDPLGQVQRRELDEGRERILLFAFSNAGRRQG